MTPDQTREVAEKIADDLTEEPKATREYIQARAEKHAKDLKKQAKPTTVEGYLEQLNSDANRTLGKLMNLLDDLSSHTQMKHAPQDRVDEIYSNIIASLNGIIERLPKKHRHKVKTE